MKRFDDGSLLLENDEDKRNFYDSCIAIHDLINFTTQYPELWELFKEQFPEKILEIREKLNIKDLIQ